MTTTSMSVRRQEQTGEMIPLLKRHEVQVLLRAGHTQKDVAARAGVSLRAVRRIQKEEEVTGADDASERHARAVGRPSKATPYSEPVRAWLSEAPSLPTQELLRRATEAGYTGHKTAFYALVAGLRPPRSTPVVRFEGLPGEFSQHDFGQVDVTFVDGRQQRVHFFCSRLKYSRFVAVSLVDNERVEPLVRNLALHFVLFGELAADGRTSSRPRDDREEGRQGARCRAVQRHLRPGHRRHRRRRRRCARGAKRSAEGRSVEHLDQVGEGRVLQAPQVPGRGRLARSSSRPGSSRSTHPHALAGHGRDSGNAPPAGAGEASAHQGVSGKAGAAHPGVRWTHRRSALRGRAVLDGARGHQHRRHAVSLRGPRPHRRRALRVAAPATPQGRATSAATRAPRRQDRRRARQARPSSTRSDSSCSTWGPTRWHC